MFTQIALAADEDRREILKAELARYGYSVAPHGSEPSENQAILIDPEAKDASDHIKQDVSDELFRSILVSPFATDVSYPAGFALSPSVQSFVQQFRIHLRQREILQEANLRQETLEKLGASFVHRAGIQSARDKHVLYYGEPSALYLRFKAAMVRQGYTVQAVLTERTAFEALRTHNPAAFIVHIQNTFYPFELLDHIQGRADLKHMPVMGIADTSEILPDTLDNLAALIRFGTDIDAAAVSLTDYVKKSLVSSPVLAPDCMSPARDAYANCFSREFAQAHIPAQAENAILRRQPMSGASVRPFKLDTGAELSAQELSPFSSLLNSVVRQQDFVTRKSWVEFSVTLPGADQRSAKEAMERARRVIELTPAKTGEYFSFDFNIQTLQPLQSAAQFSASLLTEAKGSVDSKHQSNVA